MKLFGFEVHRTKSKQGVSPLAKRAYQSAVLNRLTADWTTTNKSANAELRTTLRPMRARARELEQNNSYAKKFLNMIHGGVIGPNGIRLQSRPLESDGQTVDRADSKLIEGRFEQWSQKGICTMDGALSFIDAQRLFIKSVARDGEILVRKVTGNTAGNKFGFALQFIEADQLDEDHCRDLGNGSKIYMGVELNAWSRPVAYHVLNEHPGNDTYAWSGKRYTRIPADEIMHLFVVDRAGQTRGVPWMHAGMQLLKMHGAYQEAELVAARVAAAKMGFFVSPDGDAMEGEEGADGSLTMEAEAGMFEQLPNGTDFRSWDPQHPNSGYGEFTKDLLRSFSSGVGVAYNGLGNDLEGVNFSSIRQGAIEERDSFRALQVWCAQHFMQPVFEDWLKWSMTTGALPLPPRKFGKFVATAWQPRGWQWIDPKKDIEANIAMINAGLKSRSDVMAEQGRDFDDTISRLKAEEDALDKAGIRISTDTASNVPPQNGEVNNAEQDDEDT